MPSEREQLAQALRAQAEQAIQKLLAELPDKADVNMSIMERLTGEMGGEFMQGTLQTLSDSQQRDAGEGWCEQCRQRMHKRGKRKKRVVTVRGEVEIERQYYVCPGCGVSSFPPG